MISSNSFAPFRETAGRSRRALTGRLLQEECGKWGGVERLVIYNERQSEDDDPAQARVKIFVQYKQPDGKRPAARRPPATGARERALTRGMQSPDPRL